MKREDLRKLILAAARVARDESILAPLVSSTGLSCENVKLGLAHHLELDALDEELDALIANTHKNKHVHVILSPSVFVAPLRAIAIAMAASDRVTVKPSQREPHFARALVEALADPRVTLASDFPNEGEIHIYGLDETIKSVRRAAGPDVIVRGHGIAMGIALVTGDFARAADALASDVVAFDQRGCLSPMVAFALGDARAFAKIAFDALEARAKEIPRGAIQKGEAQDFAWWASTMEVAGVLHRGESCAVGALDERVYPPSGRHLLVHAIESPEDLPKILDRDARFVIAIGSDDVDLARRVAPPHARVSALGEMQRPRLDGFVDRRGEVRYYSPHE